MAFHVRHPVWITTAPGQAAWAFALLFFVESLARASVATVLPLHAYDLFGNKEAVSWVYTCVALAALALSFTIPAMIRHLSRRWSYTVGCFSVAACGAFLATDSEAGQIAAMFARTFGAATLNITLNLYIMDHIRKNDLVHSEPLRYAVSTLAWIAAPLAGVWLYHSYGVWAAGV
ncbi:MAG: MFS transporter, partial [Pseudomonadota bacterium]|nr:MFS transporter [Pseudomonadota bacterium]